jgi:hypothetical protein
VLVGVAHADELAADVSAFRADPPRAVFEALAAEGLLQLRPDA